MTATRTAAGSATRWAGVAAIAFVVFFVVGLVLFNTPESDASVDEWSEFFADSGDRTSLVLHGYAWALAGIAFLVCVSALREPLRAAVDWLGTLSLVTGVTFAVTLLFAAAATTAIAGGIEFGDVPEEGAGEFGRWFEQLGFGMLLICGMFAAGVFVVAASTALLRARVIPGWLAVVGYVVGPIVFIFGVTFLPLFLFVLWMLVLGIVLLVRQPASPTTATP